MAKRRGWESGLPYKKVLDARRRAADAAWLGYHNRSNIHYTQGSARWSGINSRKHSRKDQHPNQADCSSFATWCLWNGLYLPYGVRDTVNGSNWRAGYTGTMLAHGRRKSVRDARKGDLVLYGRPGTTGGHVAIIVGWSAPPSKGGRPMVISHGSEPGPYYLPYNYRSDVMSIRRYI